MAYLSNLDQPHAAVSYAFYLAQMLRKGLILLHISDEKYTRMTPAEAEPRLQQLCATLPEAAPVSYVALKGETRKVIGQLPVLIGAVAMVCHVDVHARRRSPQHPRALLRNFADCKVAYLTVQEPMPDTQGIRDVALSVNFKK